MAYYDDEWSEGTGIERPHCKKTWTPKEDETIMALVALHGAVNWSLIADGLEGRTGKQCRERYHNHLQPNIKKGGWTEEEDRKIIQLQAKYGNVWARIAQELPGRTDNAVKNRWHAAMRSQMKALENNSRTVKHHVPMVPTLPLHALQTVKSESADCETVCSSSGNTTDYSSSIEDIIRKYSPRFENDMALSLRYDLNMISHGHHMHSHISMSNYASANPTPRTVRPQDYASVIPSCTSTLTMSLEKPVDISSPEVFLSDSFLFSWSQMDELDQTSSSTLTTVSALGDFDGSQFADVFTADNKVQLPEVDFNMFEKLEISPRPEVPPLSTLNNSQWKRNRQITPRDGYLPNASRFLECLSSPCIKRSRDGGEFGSEFIEDVLNCMADDEYLNDVNELCSMIMSN